jgi:hypothetical protein
VTSAATGFRSRSAHDAIGDRLGRRGRTTTIRKSGHWISGRPSIRTLLRFGAFHAEGGHVIRRLPGVPCRTFRIGANITVFDRGLVRVVASR